MKGLPPYAITRDGGKTITGMLSQGFPFGVAVFWDGGLLTHELGLDNDEVRLRVELGDADEFADRLSQLAKSFRAEAKRLREYMAQIDSTEAQP